MTAVSTSRRSQRRGAPRLLLGAFTQTRISRSVFVLGIASCAVPDKFGGCGGKWRPGEDKHPAAAPKGKAPRRNPYRGAPRRECTGKGGNPSASGGRTLRAAPGFLVSATPAAWRGSRSDSKCAADRRPAPVLCGEKETPARCALARAKVCRCCRPFHSSADGRQDQCRVSAIHRSGIMKSKCLLALSALLISGCAQVNDQFYSKKNFTSETFAADMSECKRQNPSFVAIRGYVAR